MTQEIIVRDTNGEMFYADINIYRVAANPFSIGLHITRKDHIHAIGAGPSGLDKRDKVHIILDNAGIRALLDELKEVI
jgi:hypothetical protein